MSVEIAKAHYLGKDGYKKLNCAQAVLRAFKDRFDLTEDVIDQCGACGGGRAPEGQCGSLYAARVMLGAAHQAEINDCENALLERAGSIKCREIRAARKLACVGCVETIAACIEKIGK